MVANYDTFRLRVSQLPSCNDGWAFYAKYGMNEEFARTLGRRIRAAREAKGLTQEALGTPIAVKKANLSQWENGRHMPDVEQFAGLCDAMSISADWLLGREHPGLSAEALAEARAYDALSVEDKRKWRALRMTMFNPA